ncbi:MAG TPA: ABC transporter permease subunit [Roseomonas sp.]|jgi:ABC-type spermidine/putrescine transport system permease subunit II
MRRLAAIAVLLALLAPLPLLFLAGGAGGWGGPLGNSLLTAAAAALGATLLGTAAGIGLWGGFAGRGLAVALIALPLLLPPVIPGAALLLIAGRMGHGAGWPALVLWHVLVAAPLVAVMIHAALGRANPVLYRAALACGATPALAARRLLRPRLLPAVAAGAGLAFALSMGESSLAILLRAETLPAVSLPGGVAAGSPLAALLVAGALGVILFLRPRPEGK